METLAYPFDKLPLAAGEVATFCKSNGTFHRSFDEAFACSNIALYHFRKPLFRRAKWERFDYSKIQSVELVEMKPPVLLTLGLLAIALAAIGATAASSPSNPMAWLLGALPLYFPYLAYRSGRDRLCLVIKLDASSYRISAPLDGYKDETLLDNSILRELHERILKAKN
tara:strand:- start:4310 stop:4816 length:507 start_codon:yes stop_codon:yes gene_type:complete